MGRLQLDPMMMDELVQRRRRALPGDPQADGPQQMRFFDQSAGMMPQSAPSDFAPPTAQASMTPLPPPPDPAADERSEMIRGQLQTRLGAQMGGAGAMGAMAGLMGRGAASGIAAAPNAGFTDTPLPPPPPPANGQLGALGANPHFSSIVTGSGTRTMAYPQGPDGLFGRGQDLGNVPFEAQGNPADGFRSSFLKNLYGTGAPSSFLPAELAAKMAEREMTNRTAQQEGNLHRQNILDREMLEQKGRVEAANQGHKHGQSAAQYSGAVNAFLSGQGPQFAQADAFARGLGGGMSGGGAPMAAPAGVAGAAGIPQLPAGMAPPPDQDVMGRVNKLMMQEATSLPKNLKYEIPGLGMGANRKPAMLIEGGADGKISTDVANKLLGRFSAEKFGDAEFAALNDVLSRSAGGQDVRKALLAQMATDELAFQPPPVQGRSGLGAFIGTLTGGRTNVYPEKLEYGDYPGMSVEADAAETWLGQGLKTLRDRHYAGGLPYRSVNIGGERIPIDPGNSMATLSTIFGGDEAMKKAIGARRSIYPSAYKALAGPGAK